MEKGIIRLTPNDILECLGYKHLQVDSLTCDIFSNQVIIVVKGNCDLYPASIKPIPPFTAVTGL